MTAVACLVFLVAGTTIPLSASARDAKSILNSSDSEANNMTSPIMTDILILRPIALAALVFSVALFIVPIAPITLLTRPSEIGKPVETLIYGPARYIWVDPLGSH